MNNDAISRSALLDALPKDTEMLRYQVVEVICNAPALDVAPVVHGHMFERIKHHLLNDRFSGYPACDHINYAIQFMLENPVENRGAIVELCYAICKANGYFYEHIQKQLEEHNIWKF